MQVCYLGSLRYRSSLELFSILDIDLIRLMVPDPGGHYFIPRLSFTFYADPSRGCSLL